MSTDQKNDAEILHKLFDQLPDEKFSKPQLGETHKPNIDVGLAMKTSLEQPTLYPPLAESVFAGDSVAIVLQSNLPHAKIVLESLLEQLMQINVEPADIVVVISAKTAQQLGIDATIYEQAKENLAEGMQPGTFVVEFGFHGINFQVHDAENEAAHAYLAANAEGEPIHVNRVLVDADVVIPIGSPTAGDMNQQTDCIYPDFSNETSRARLAKGQSSFVSRWQEIELANDSLGSFFTIQVVFGPGETIQNIFAGSRPEVTKIARDTTNELWAFDWHQGEVDVVVATIESKSGDQGWDDFANALITASHVSTEQGPIVIWSEISARSDRNIHKALMSQFEEGISKKLTKTMQHVAAIVNERPVYLRSRLKRDAVEELGLGFIETAEEIVRISDSYQTALLIRDAHKCQLRTATVTETEAE